MFRIALTLTVVLLGAAAGLAQQQPVDPSRVLGRLLAVKPTPDMLKWQRSPWARSLQEARRMAKAENRPLFLWASDDEPLDRC